jgi:hypothetical protein
MRLTVLGSIKRQDPDISVLNQITVILQHQFRLRQFSFFQYRRGLVEARSLRHGYAKVLKIWERGTIREYERP